jgi:hypothetical protein
MENIHKTDKSTILDLNKKIENIKDKQSECNGSTNGSNN